MGSEPIDPNLPIPTCGRICRSQYGSESTNPNLGQNPPIPIWASIYQSQYGGRIYQSQYGEESTNPSMGAESTNPNMGKNLPIPIWGQNLPIPIWRRIYQSQPDAESNNLWARNHKSQSGVRSLIPLRVGIQSKTTIIISRVQKENQANIATRNQATRICLKSHTHSVRIKTEG